MCNTCDVSDEVSVIGELVKVEDEGCYSYIILFFILLTALQANAEVPTLAVITTILYEETMINNGHSPVDAVTIY